MVVRCVFNIVGTLFKSALSRRTAMGLHSGPCPFASLGRGRLLALQVDLPPLLRQVDLLHEAVRELVGVRTPSFDPLDVGRVLVSREPELCFQGTRPESLDADGLAQPTTLRHRQRGEELLAGREKRRGPCRGDRSRLPGHGSGAVHLDVHRSRGRHLTLC